VRRQLTGITGVLFYKGIIIFYLNIRLVYPVKRRFIFRFFAGGVPEIFCFGAEGFVMGQYIKRSGIYTEMCMQNFFLYGVDKRANIPPAGTVITLEKIVHMSAIPGIGHIRIPKTLCKQI
jgi:hypothetical protein